MTRNAVSMPRDRDDNPIPVLPPRAAHTLSVTSGTLGTAIELDKNTSAIWIEVDALVYYNFGTDAVSADNNSFQRSATDARAIGKPANATHIIFYGGSEDASGYMEEM